MRGVVDSECVLVAAPRQVTNEPSRPADVISVEVGQLWLGRRLVGGASEVGEVDWSPVAITVRAHNKAARLRITPPVIVCMTLENALPSISMAEVLRPTRSYRSGDQSRMGRNGGDDGAEVH
jgi:hypothetical protein